MLIRFSVENAFCFHEPATLSMVASSDKRHPEHVSVSASPNMPGLLRTAGIYGANGHGKTKFVEALLFCKRIVCGDERAFKENFERFLLEGKERAPSKFILEFRSGEKNYEYGLVIDNEKISEEWLFVIGPGKEEMIFTRELKGEVDDKADYDWDFGKGMLGSKISGTKFKTKDYLDFLSAGVKEQQSFIQEAGAKRVEYIKSVADWFGYTLQVIGAEASYVQLLDRARDEKGFLAFLNKKIASSDTGISSLSIKRTPAPLDVIKTMFGDDADIKEVENLKEDEYLLFSNGGPKLIIEKDNDGLFFVEFISLHKNRDNEDIEFDLNLESSGTQRLLDLFPMIYDLVKRDCVYIVDELDRKLHPLLAYKFVEDFLSANKGQLIFTTHTTFLLDLDLLRRDEVWFVQKKGGGASDIYSMADFKVRLDLDVRRGYLNGRFGGIPFLGDLKALGWT